MADNIPHPIAIIGSACRLPGSASSPSKLWELLMRPRDLLKEVPRDRFHWEGFYRQDGLHSASKTNRGYFLDENIRMFDPHFFGINPAEAETIDPQHRLLLENVYEAIESAGLTLEDLQGTATGVFVGMMGRNYYENATKDLDACSGQILSTGTSRAMAANRISFTFDFRGPSINIDTACSSSMMAIHLAVGSLRTGESTIAFACGTNLNLNTSDWISLTKMNMISSDGRCKMFDETADGYGRGEGVGVVCLKRLDAALRDGDNIECVIRETGTNQDGHTKGITVPSAEAQAALIRNTYRSAGLELTEAGSRPSFFEAHGTGTLLGDPLEAEAIQAAFFPPGCEYADEEILYIGSIKTIIGHTEGTAGIAGVLRAALAVRYGFIPPNMLYARMNPQVAPYMKHLRLAAAALPWPTLPSGCPRRASINSFGFGGSNVHVIIESFEDASNNRMRSLPPFGITEPVFTPFTFAGVSEKALVSVMENYISFLESLKSPISLRDLAWTLQYKRSHFHFRCSIAARTLDELLGRLRNAVQTVRSRANTPVVRASPSNHLQIMGVFTGQGAQWATMGRELIDQSPYAHEIIAKLDYSLASLPAETRPTWRLADELAIDSHQSRINEAVLSQPLTTAIQILLVDLLSAAGVKLHAVVGHSSGEIAAAYAAGFIKAEDAIRIAYYRGLHSRQAVGSDGKEGAMLATALAPEQARDFCDLPEFQQRIVPGAYNSPRMVTLSGDADAIDAALQKLETQGIFARKLNVQKAYHSYHMQHCAGPYLESLEQLDIVVLPRRKGFPTWFSSVYPCNQMDRTREITGPYWVENLTSPVRFYGAITTAVCESGMPDVFIEVGPHPALEKPVRQTLADVSGNGIVYIGLLKRGINSIVALSEALGHMWERFGKTAMNFAAYDQTLYKGLPPTLLKDLPTYPWAHDREYWWENRFLRRQFQAAHPPTELLGQPISMGAQHESKWRRFLQPKVVPWLLDHKLNGVAVLPGSAYVVMATTAARRFFQKQSIEMIEVKNLSFKIPLAFPDGITAIETVLTIGDITITAQQAQAKFVVDFCSHQRQDELMTAAQGRLVVHFGLDLDREHPTRLSQHAPLTTLDPGVFYDHLSRTGYGYTGPFQSIISIQRRMDFATGKIALTPSEMMFHPAILDGLFQATFAAENFPGDSALSNFRVPSLVRSIKIFPARCDEMALSKEAVSVDVMRTGPSEYGGLLYCTYGPGTVMQMEGFCTAPFKMSSPDDDLKMFSEVVWRQYVPDARLLASSCGIKAHSREAALSCERVALFYLRKINENISYHDEKRALPHLQQLLGFARLTTCEVLLGLLPHMRKEWLDDTKDDIARIVAQYSDIIDMRLLDAVGKAYPQIFRGDLSALTVLTEDDMLTQLYQNGLGFPEANATLSKVVSIISHRSPSIRILEVGAGTGSATGPILESATYSSYTFTDLSTAFLGPAKEKFKRFAKKMSFSVLDLEKDFGDQGFHAQSFEIVVASNVLHALTDTTASLVRIRQLLRPGGYLVCLELPATSLIKNTVIMGGLPGWWLGKDTGRPWSPALTQQQWDRSLKDAGFAGVDSTTPISDGFQQSYRILVAQAVDDRIVALRDPLTCRLPKGRDSIMIIGGESAVPKGLFKSVETLLSHSFEDIIRVSSLEDIKGDTVISGVVLSLVELEEPVFQDMTSRKWAALQKLFSEAKDIIWVTTGCKSPQNVRAAYSQMVVGLGRTIRNEYRDIRLRFLDVDNREAVTGQLLSHNTLEWYTLGRFAAEGWRDDVLFGHESELAVENGVTHVPVIVHSTSQNSRYNSRQRRITQEVNPRDYPAQICLTPSSLLYDIREAFHKSVRPAETGTVMVKMLYSTLYAVKIGKLGFSFVGLGVRQNGSYAITLHGTISSVLHLPSTAVYCFAPGILPSMHHLRVAVAHLVAERVVRAGNSKGTSLILASDPLYISLIREKAAKREKRVVFITSNRDFRTEDISFVHHNSMETHIRHAIPEDTSLLMNLSNLPQDETLFKRVSSLLKQTGAKIKTIDTVLRAHMAGCDYAANSPQAYAAAEEVETALKEIAGLQTATCDSCGTQVISPKNLVQRPLQHPSTILDWTAVDVVPITVQPAIETVKFSANKSYVVIGTSDLAQSLCELMINNGAKYVVMASRHPSGLAGWVRDMASKGAFVDIKTVDVTNDESVGRMLASVREAEDKTQGTLRPIGGIIHAGLALKDAAFSKMTFEELRLATDVKAKGSLILHEHLSKEKLDFFILTSSISYTAGNPGQANYNCGNAFMAGLARYRRNMGLAASVVHLGRVTGVGYITRTSSGTAYDLSLEDLGKKGMYPVSERDLHHIFAEAVLASPADSGRDPEIITGLRNITPEMLGQCPWAKQPMFSHLRTDGTMETAVKTMPQLSVRQQLSQQLAAVAGTSLDEPKSPIQEFIRAAVVDRLSVLLQIDTEDIDVGVSLLDLGIDSLVASEIGSWMRKELRVQVPHSMIFGGASVADIVKFAVTHLDKGWVMLENGGVIREAQGKGKEEA